MRQREAGLIAALTCGTKLAAPQAHASEGRQVQCLVLPRLRGGTRYWTKSAPRFTPARKRRREQVIL